MAEIQLTSNYQKHLHTNPIQKFLINNFYRSLLKLATSVNPDTILDAGCGEGFTLNKFKTGKIGKHLEGIDRSETAIKLGKKQFKNLTLKTASIYELPYKDNSFDLVVCTEVLEHLEDPNTALLELIRVSKHHILFSVPNEPFFMISNLLRGKNFLRFGNDSEHIQHWTVFSFINSLKKNKLTAKVVMLPPPWTMILAEKQQISQKSI